MTKHDKESVECEMENKEHEEESAERGKAKVCSEKVQDRNKHFSSLLALNMSVIQNTKDWRENRCEVISSDELESDDNSRSTTPSSAEKGNVCADAPTDAILSQVRTSYLTGTYPSVVGKIFHCNLVGSHLVSFNCHLRVYAEVQL